VDLLTDDIVKHDALDQAVATLREHIGGIALEGDVSVERVLLAKALVLQLALWPDQEVAESVDIDLGMPVLRQLKVGESVLLTVKQPANLDEQPEEIQFEIKRLPGVTPPREILACHGNVINGRPTCCATLGRA
jgi:hypothetical protein